MVPNHVLRDFPGINTIHVSYNIYNDGDNIDEKIMNYDKYKDPNVNAAFFYPTSEKIINSKTFSTTSINWLQYQKVNTINITIKLLTLIESLNHLKQGYF